MISSVHQTSTPINSQERLLYMSVSHVGLYKKGGDLRSNIVSLPSDPRLCVRLSQAEQPQGMRDDCGLLSPILHGRGRAAGQ